MTLYSVQPRDQIFVKSSGFLSFANNIGKNIGKNISINTVRNFLFMLINLLQMHLKLLQKNRFKKQQKQLGISLVINR